MPKLNPDLQTRKLSSLPSDLKSIAEEILIEKFGKEAVVKKKEVRKKSSSSFPGYGRIGIGHSEVRIDMGLGGDEAAVARFSDAIAKSLVHAESRREPRVDREIDFHTRSYRFRTEITRADARAFRDAIQRLDYENAPRHKRRASVSPHFTRELMSHPDFPYYAAFRDDRYRGYNYGQYVGELFGVPIFAVEGVYPYIIAE